MSEFKKKRARRHDQKNDYSCFANSFLCALYDFKRIDDPNNTAENQAYPKEAIL